MKKTLIVASSLALVGQRREAGHGGRTDQQRPADPGGSGDFHHEPFQSLELAGRVLKGLPIGTPLGVLIGKPCQPLSLQLGIWPIQGIELMLLIIARDRIRPTWRPC